MKKPGRVLALVAALFSLPAAAGDVFTYTGEGYKIDVEIPARPLVKVFGPAGARAEIYDHKGQLITEQTLPFEFVPPVPNEEIEFRITLANGRLIKDTFELKKHAEHRLKVNELPPAEPRKQAASTEPKQEASRADEDTVEATEVRPSDDEALEELAIALRRKVGSNDRLKLLERKAASLHFTVEQVAVLLQLFSSSGDKLRAIEITRSHMFDPENGPELSELFSTSSDKHKVRQLFAGGEDSP
jgi:hypothetical protein